MRIIGSAIGIFTVLVGRSEKVLNAPGNNGYPWSAVERHQGMEAFVLMWLNTEKGHYLGSCDSDVIAQWHLNFC